MRDEQIRDTEELITDLGAVSELTLGFSGQPVEALTIPDHQDKPM